MTAPAPHAPTLLEVKGLKKLFPVTEGVLARRAIGEVRAVDGVDFTLRRGETLGLVGESAQVVRFAPRSSYITSRR